MSMQAQFGNFTVNPVFNKRGNQCAGHSANTQCFKRGRIKTLPVKFDDRGNDQTYFGTLRHHRYNGLCSGALLNDNLSLCG